MIKGKVKEKLSKESILSKVDDYSIYTFYLGQAIDTRKKYPSPFKQGGVDSTPNLSFFLDRDNKLQFTDFARSISGDCFKFVQELFNVDFNQALQKIDQDLNLGIQTKANPVFKIQISKRPDSIHQQEKLIQVIPREFTEEDLKYWHSYQITRSELIRNNVMSIRSLYVNKKLIPNYNKTLRFAYKFDDYLKIYSPLAKDYKWISSCPNDYISGFDTIKDKVYAGTQDSKLIISKSVKDQIVLSKFFKDVCSTQNESSASINEEDIAFILRYYKAKNVYISYDNDEAGIKASQYYTYKYGFSYVNVPNIYRNEGIKDWSDLVQNKDLETMENYLRIVKKLI